MFYKYYKEIIDGEHMLYASEIAIKYELFNNDKPAYKAVFVAIKRYCEKHNITLEKYFYCTKNGLRQVFPKCLYEPAMEEYIQNKNKKG